MIWFEGNVYQYIRMGITIRKMSFGDENSWFYGCTLWILISDLGFTARQDYFIHFEQSQLLCGAKTGDPREKPPDHPQAELRLSHMRPELGSNP